MIKQRKPHAFPAQLIGFDKKRLHLYHSLHLTGETQTLAGNEQMLLHVDLAGPHSAPFSEHTLALLQAIEAQQGDLPKPDYAGRVIGLPNTAKA